ncbi:MAG: ribokinase [Candidatus Hermodarchaeota archaeon]
MIKKEKNENYVLIIGSSNMDLNIYSKRLPNPGETVTGGTFRQFLGGKGANQAVASVRSGSKTIFIGKIGTDAFGDQMITQLTKEGIDMSHVIRDPEHSSGVAFIMIDENGENMISVAPGANFKLTPEEIKKKAELIQKASAIIVQMEIPIETIAEIFNIAAKGKPIKILNPAPLKKIPVSIFKNIDIIIPNRGELLRLHMLCGYNELRHVEGAEMIIEASKDIAILGVKAIITTLGNKGSLIYNSEENEIIEVPAFKVDAIDTVGAGDCFNGVLASKLCQGTILSKAVKYANAAASIAVTRRGAQASMPSQEEIEEQFKKYNKLINP